MNIMQSFVKFQNMDPEMMVYSIFLYMLLQSLIKFQSVVPEIQMKRAKRDLT